MAAAIHSICRCMNVMNLRMKVWVNFLLGTFLLCISCGVCIDVGPDSSFFFVVQPLTWIQGRLRVFIFISCSTINLNPGYSSGFLFKFNLFIFRPGSELLFRVFFFFKLFNCEHESRLLLCFFLILIVQLHIQSWFQSWFESFHIILSSLSEFCFGVLGAGGLLLFE
jgi:hypothetical protein